MKLFSVLILVLSFSVSAFADFKTKKPAPKKGSILFCHYDHIAYDGDAQRLDIFKEKDGTYTLTYKRMASFWPQDDVKEDVTFKGLTCRVSKTDSLLIGCETKDKKTVIHTSRTYFYSHQLKFTAVKVVDEKGKYSSLLKDYQGLHSFPLHDCVTPKTTL